MFAQSPYREDTSHGLSHMEELVDPHLVGMVEDEIENPVLNAIQPVIERKRLMLCVSAYDRFVQILSTIAGKRELARAKALFDICCIIQDASSSLSQCLKVMTNSK
eukprot:m.37344 g.37344  ORF g.37344 m.37344 type:complete len:106 (+) comp6726_c1_seq15:1132-1449(+)